MHVLVTGGTGRIGRPLVRSLLAAGKHVTVIAARPPLENPWAQADPERLILVTADAFDLTQIGPHLVGCDSLIHLACTTVIAGSEADAPRDLDHNLLGTLALFRQAQEVGVARFVFPSSGGAVYGNPERLPVPEDAPKRPISYHGAMKLGCEHYLHAAGKYGRTHCTVLRIANPYGFAPGARQQGIIDIFIKRLQQGKPIAVWGSAEIARDFLHVDDLCRAFLAALHIAPPGFGIYNIGTGNAVTIGRVLEELGKYFDLEDKVIHEPGRDVDVTRIALDVKKADRELNWRPEIDLETGIARVLNG